MSGFILDNSVAMRWILATDKKNDQSYAEKVLKSFIDSSAVVPDLWHLEATNVLLNAEKQKLLTSSEVEQFLSKLESLPIEVDPVTSSRAFNRTLNLARLYKLSSYDAAYLELALREALPLATLDKDLLKAMIKSGVDRFNGYT